MVAGLCLDARTSSLLFLELERLSVDCLIGERFTLIVSRVSTLCRSVRRSVVLWVELERECVCELGCDAGSRVELVVEVTRGREELGTRS